MWKWEYFLLDLDARHILRTLTSNEVSIAIKISVRLEITRAWFAATSNVHIVDSDVATTTIPAENIIVLAFICSGSCDVLDRDILNDDAVCRRSGWTTVQVVLLDIDAVNGYVLDAQVFKQNVRDEASGIGVGFDACTILSIEDDRVGKRDVGDVVI